MASKLSLWSLGFLLHGRLVPFSVIRSRVAIDAFLYMKLLNNRTNLSVCVENSDRDLLTACMAVLLNICGPIKPFSAVSE